MSELKKGDRVIFAGKTGTITEITEDARYPYRVVLDSGGQGIYAAAELKKIGASHKIGIYGAWVWKVPEDTSEAVILALSAIGQFPPPATEGWKLVDVEAGEFQNTDEAIKFIPDVPGTYVVAIGLGQEMEWQLVRR